MYAVLCLVTQSCLLCDPMDCSPPSFSVHGNSSGKNIRVGFHAFLQVIFPTQGWNWGLLHCRQILNHLSHQGSPRILEWVVYPFSRGSSLPGNWTRVSCTAGGFFTSWATREAYIYSDWVSEVAHSCQTLCSPIDCSLPGSSIHRIFQARVLEWVAILFSS